MSSHTRQLKYDNWELGCIGHSGSGVDSLLDTVAEEVSRYPESYPFSCRSTSRAPLSERRSELDNGLERHITRVKRRQLNAILIVNLTSDRVMSPTTVPLKSQPAIRIHVLTSDIGPSHPVQSISKRR